MTHAKKELHSPKHLEVIQLGLDNKQHAHTVLCNAGVQPSTMAMPHYQLVTVAPPQFKLTCPIWESH